MFTFRIGLSESDYMEFRAVSLWAALRDAKAAYGRSDLMILARLGEPVGV